ncbi:NPP1 family protein [Streptomyces phyllanthi]|uniref:Necrosis inducing protein (NPP1) n=1 Tax=Streptomyces phyllanthi TaxID=1803180 RepID=A0A5N8WDG1_9ACTN|nr:NPP1 family protein [Streptomyces phyllanthi]MPY44434.1 necrosis inducing protein (NPP1) [Streptomyces phyllanthi]
MSMRSRIYKSSLVMSMAAVLTIGLAGSASAGVLTPLPANATAFQRAFEPVYDYDTDSCYPAAAVDGNGNLNGGLNPSGSVTGGCRTANHLNNDNSYSRPKCNQGWCGIIYATYFEKDQATALGGGHRHDWESVVVWVQQGASRPAYVSVSAHGDYTTYAASAVPFWDAGMTHPKIVYHKDGVSTHAFRLAKWDETPENATGQWHWEDLVGWDNFPATWIRDRVAGANWGSANFPLKDGNFENNLNEAKPSGITFDAWG